MRPHEHPIDFVLCNAVYLGFPVSSFFVSLFPLGQQIFLIWSGYRCLFSVRATISDQTKTLSLLFSSQGNDIWSTSVLIVAFFQFEQRYLFNPRFCRCFFWLL